MTGNSFRLTHGNDLITHLPFKAMGFRHIGTEYWIERNSEEFTVVCDGSGEDENCHDGEEIDINYSDLIDTVWDNFLEDHRVYLGHHHDCNNADEV